MIYNPGKRMKPGGLYVHDNFDVPPIGSICQCYKKKTLRKRSSSPNGRQKVKLTFRLFVKFERVCDEI